MPSNIMSHFQPPPPIRTSTAGSQSSGPVSPGSDRLSITSANSRTTQSTTSAAEESFFGAIATRMRRGRSRSRSRVGIKRDRSKSPMTLPPEHMLPSTSAHTLTHSTPRPHQSRHVSSTSQSSVTSTASKQINPSLQGATRRSTSSSSGSDMWRGRHSNSWLFNDFSVTDTAKSVLHIGRKS